MKQNKILLLIAAYATVATACEIPDADLEGGGLASLTVTAANTNVDVMQVDISGQVALSYLSKQNATIEIFVNGAQAHEASLDTSESLTVDFAATIPLVPGPNDIIAEVSYDGNILSETFAVTADPASPTLTLPAWSNVFTQAGVANVTINADWTIEEVAFSIDEGAFLPAEDLGGGDYNIALTNLDIGDSALTVRVTSSNTGVEQVHLFHNEIAGIAPEFDCAQNTSMLPTSALIANNKTEVRSMVGYFGDPDGGHTLTFVIEFVDNNGNSFVNPAVVLTKGRTTADVEYNVDKFRCNNNPCSETYDISLLIDGQPVCSQTNFGNISEL